MPTVLHRLNDWAKTEPDTAAQGHKQQGQWKTLSAKEFCTRVYHLALFLETRGITKNDVGCIFSTNCPQWVHLELATLLLGAKSAGLYPNSTQKDVLYILNHTEAVLLSVQDREFYKKITGEKGDTPFPKPIRLILTFDQDSTFHPQAVTYEAALQEGKNLAAIAGSRKLEDYLAALNPHSGAFLIYTSGTTGNPKGALLSHDNLVFTSDLAIRYWHLPMVGGSLFSFLPLCHIAEKLQNIGVGITQHYLVNYCTKFENLISELPETQPTLLLCVPRLWEKMMEGVTGKIAKGKGIKKKLATWALSVGERVAAAQYSHRFVNPVDWLQLKLADKLVLSKIRFALGLGKAHTLASGAAALAPHICKWFRLLGLEILEDYGQTESTGVICMTERGLDCAGTVGKGVPGIEVKLADDGEVLTRGRHVFNGYFKEEAATSATLVGGWLHTGDLGEFIEKGHQRGMLRIRGRKKEILKTSGGKMIAPLPIEEELKAASVISQVCIVGDGRKYLSVLITLSEGTLSELQNQPEALKGQVVNLPDVLKQVQVEIDRVNRTHASYEQIKKFTILSREFSIVDGEMTPTLKMKRNVVEMKYKDLIDQMYTRPLS